MAAPAKKIFAVGFNAARVLELDQDDGSIASSNATVYGGLQLGGVVSLAMEFPTPESIAHPGNNIVLQRDVLPSLDASSGTLEVSRTDFDTIAALANVNSFSYLGNVNSIAWQTNQQGTEPTVALVAYAQAKTNSGNRAWTTYVMPKCIIVPASKGLAREQSNHSYFVQPQATTKHLTGEALTISNDGCTSAELIEYQSNYRMAYAAWTVTAAETTLLFDTNLPHTAGGAGAIKVTKNGVALTYGATADALHFVADANSVDFGAALTNGDKVVAFYELADNAVDVS